MKPVAAFQSFTFACATVIVSSAGCYTVEPPHRWDPRSDVQYFPPDPEVVGVKEAETVPNVTAGQQSDDAEGELANDP